MDIGGGDKSRGVRCKRIKPCFGISARTGLRVGARHRWRRGWGVGHCAWCDRSLDDVTEYVRLPLPEAVPPT